MPSTESTPVAMEEAPPSEPLKEPEVKKSKIVDEIQPR